MTPDPTSPEKCEHKFVFLRQEKEDKGHYRVIYYLDVFYCEKCLEYKTKTKEHRY